MRILCKIAGFILFTLPFWIQGKAQPFRDTVSQVRSAEIEWVANYPDPTSRSGRKITAGRILNSISGATETGDKLFTKPIALIRNAANELWVVDQGSTGLFWFREGKAGIASVFNKEKFSGTSLVGICEIPGMGYLFSDSRDSRLYLLHYDGKKIDSFANLLQFHQPTGLAYNAATAEVWVIETGSHAIRIVDRNGNARNTIGKRGNGPAEFNYPLAVCFDKKGNAYVVDALNYRVQVLDPQGTFIRAFGTQGNVSGTFGLPKGIATDTYGNIYVTDALFHNVQVFDQWGHFLYVFGQQGRDNGSFWMPAGLWIDSRNHIYVADSYNARVQEFRLTNVTLRNETDIH